MSGLPWRGLFLVAVVLATMARAGLAAGPQDGGSPEAAKIDRLLAEVDQATGTRREKLLQAAIRLTRDKAARLARAMDARHATTAEREDAMVEWFQARLQLADILGMRRGRPLIARVTLSVESAEQREVLGGWMAESLSEMKAIDPDLTRRLRRAEADPSQAVNLFPRLERLARQLRWQRALARYWYARTTSSGPERKRLLDMSIAEIEQMLVAGPSDPQRRELQLLKGSCLREKGRYGEAVSLLSELVRKASGDAPREKVLFELALAKIGYAASKASPGSGTSSAETRRAFAEALEAVTDYQALSTEAHPAPLIDVRAMMLHERLCRRESALGAAERKRARGRLDGVLRGFLGTYSAPSVRAPVAQLLFTNWPDTQSGDAPAPVLVLLATHHLFRADAGLADRTLADLPEAERESLRQDWQRAVLLAERARSEDTDTLRPVVPDALWVIGSAQMKLSNQANASQAYEALSRDYPAHPYAKPAALRRVGICGDRLEAAVAGGKTSVRYLRVELVDALSTLLTNWAGSKKADEWRLALGWQCGALAEEVESDEQYQRWGRRAVRNYDAVERTGPQGLTARFLSLQQQYKLTRRIPPAKRTETVDLARRLQTFSDMLKNETDNGRDETRKDQLIDWAGRCELYGLILRHSILKDEQALSLLSSMEDRWPDECDALHDAERYLFRDALDNGHFERAAQSLAAYEQRYGKAAVSELVEMFLSRVQATLESDSGAPGDPQVEPLYSRWAEWLFRSCEEDSPLFYRAAMFHADALTRQGNAAVTRPALQLYDQLAAADARRQASERELIQQKVASIKRTIQTARPNPTVGRRLQDELYELMERFGGRDSHDSAFIRVKKALRAFAAAESDEAQNKDLAKAKVLQALDGWAERLEQTVPIDIELAIGRARCLRALNRPQEAIAILTPLCSGLRRDSAMFWTVQIERAECIAMSDDPKVLKQLLVVIRQLRLLDPALGRPNVLKRFNRLESLLDEKLKALGPKAEGDVQVSSETSAR